MYNIGARTALKDLENYLDIRNDLAQQFVDSRYCLNIRKSDIAASIKNKESMKKEQVFFDDDDYDDEDYDDEMFSEEN